MKSQSETEADAVFTQVGFRIKLSKNPTKRFISNLSLQRVPLAIIKAKKSLDVCFISLENASKYYSNLIFPLTFLLNE